MIEQVPHRLGYRVYFSPFGIPAAAYQEIVTTFERCFHCDIEAVGRDQRHYYVLPTYSLAERFLLWTAQVSKGLLTDDYADALLAKRNLEGAGCSTILLLSRKPEDRPMLVFNVASDEGYFALLVRGGNEIENWDAEITDGFPPKDYFGSQPTCAVLST